jgi:hypothetical protein
MVFDKLDESKFLCAELARNFINYTPGIIYKTLILGQGGYSYLAQHADTANAQGDGGESLFLSRRLFLCS